MKQRNKIARLIALLIVTVLMAGLLSACGDSDSVEKGKSRTFEPTDTPTVSPTPDISTTPDPDQPGKDDPDEKTVLTMWCTAVTYDSTRHAYEAAIADFEKNHPDIVIQWEACDIADYNYKLKIAAAADESLPDIMFLRGGYYIDDFTGWTELYCLDQEYEKHKADLPGRMLTNAMVDGHLYGVPYYLNNVVLFANMDILQSIGYSSIPQTYDEFLTCCQKLKEADRIPIGCALSEAWCVEEVLESMIEKNIEPQVLDDIFRGRASWDNPGVAATVDMFLDLVNKGYIGPTDSNSYNDDVKAEFLAGKYPFYINGSWNCYDVYLAGQTYGINFDVAEFPVISQQGSLGRLIGAPSDHLAVSAHTKDPEAVAGYAFELAQLLSHYCYEESIGFPAWSIDIDDEHLNPLTRKVARNAENANALVGFGDVVTHPEEMDAYYRTVFELIRGECNGTEFVKRIVEKIEMNR